MAHVRDLEQIQRFRDRLRDWLVGSEAPDFRLSRADGCDLLLWLDDAIRRWSAEADAYKLERERLELGRLSHREATERLRDAGVLRAEGERTRDRDLRLARLWAALRTPGAMVATAEYEQRLGALPPGELDGGWVTATPDPDRGVIKVGNWTGSRSLSEFCRIARFRSAATARTALNTALSAARDEWDRRLSEGESHDQILADLGIPQDLRPPGGKAAQIGVPQE